MDSLNNNIYIDTIPWSTVKLVLVIAKNNTIQYLL